MVYSASEELNCPLALVMVTSDAASERESETIKSIPAERTCTHLIDGKAASTSGSCLRALGQLGETNKTFGTSMQPEDESANPGRKASKSDNVVPVHNILEPKGNELGSNKAALASSLGSDRFNIFASWTILSGDILMR